MQNRARLAPRNLFSSTSRRFANGNEGIHLQSGAVMPRPAKIKMGLLKVFILVIPFMLAGGYLSSTGAELLHEYDIFSPEDD